MESRTIPPPIYRPVSLTSYVSKIVEKIIHVKLLPHLNQFNIISECQHGFPSRRSTTTSLLKFWNGKWL